MSSGDDQRMDTDADADDQELQRNRQVEAELALTRNLAISDPTGGSFTNEKDLSPITPELVQSLYTEDVAIQEKAMRQFRKLLSDTPKPLCDEIIKSGAVPRFVHFLKSSRYPKLQFESASVLAYITGGNSALTQVVIEAGAVPILIRLLSSTDKTVVEKSVGVLGNIACDSTESRLLVLNSNVLPPLLGLFNDDNVSLSLLRIATLVLRDLCGAKKPPLNFEQVSQCLPILARLMVNEDEEILFGVCLAMSRLCDGSNEQIQVIVESGVCPLAIQLLSHSSTDVVKGAILLLRRITSRDPSQTQVLINENALPIIGSFLSHELESIVKDACRTLSNITVGSEQQIQALIDANILPSLVELLHYEDFKIRLQAAKVISNAIAGGTEQQIVYIVDAGAIPPLCIVLFEIEALLHASVLYKILYTGESVAKAAGSAENPYATLVEQCGLTSLGPEDNKEITFLYYIYLKIKETAMTIIRTLFGSTLEHISN